MNALEFLDGVVLVPREEYNILVSDQTQLSAIRALASVDDSIARWGHYSDATSKSIDLLLGIERKEKTA